MAAWNVNAVHHFRSGTDLVYRLNRLPRTLPQK